MSERNEIIERYKRMREDPMTPQYLTGMGQSGSPLDYQEAHELGELACRDGHLHLSRHEDRLNGEYLFCSRCGHRVCPICQTDVGTLIASWHDHRESHA